MLGDQINSQRRNIFTILSSIGLGIISVISVYLHLGLLQNFEFYEKLILLSIGIIPTSFLIYFLINYALPRFSIKTLVIGSIISLLISSLIIFLFYKAPLMVKTHSITIDVPLEVNGVPNNAFGITKIEINSVLNKKLNHNPFYISQKNISVQTDSYSPGSTLTANLKYSGNLVIFTKTTNCPSFITVTEENQTISQDLCEVNSNDGFVVSNSESGVLSWKWKLAENIVKVIDFLLLLLLIQILIPTVIQFIRGIKEKNRQIYIDGRCNKLIMFCLGSSLICIFVLTIVFSGFTWFPVIVYFLIFELLIIAFFSIIKPPYKDNLHFLLLLLFLCGGIILNFIGREEFHKELRIMPSSLSYSQYSLNSAINQIIGFPTYIIKYGYDNVLNERNIIIPTTYLKELGFDESIFSSQVNIGKITYSDKPILISEDEFQCMNSLLHTEWKDKYGNRYFFIDEQYYAKEDSVLIGRFEKNWLLFPVSGDQTMEICK